MTPCYSVYKTSLILLLLVLLLLLLILLYYYCDAFAIKNLTLSSLLSLLLVFSFFFFFLLLLQYVIVFYFHCYYSYQALLFLSLSSASLVSKSTLLLSSYEFQPLKFSLTSNSFVCIKKSESVSKFCICTLFSIFIYVTFVSLLKLKSHCFSLVTLEIKVLFIHFNFRYNFLS